MSSDRGYNEIDSMDYRNSEKYSKFKKSEEPHPDYVGNRNYDLIDIKPVEQVIIEATVAHKKLVSIGKLMLCSAAFIAIYLIVPGFLEKHGISPDITQLISAASLVAVMGFGWTGILKFARDLRSPITEKDIEKYKADIDAELDKERKRVAEWNKKNRKGRKRQHK